MADSSAKDKLKALAAETDAATPSRAGWIPGWVKAAVPYLGTAAIITFLYFNLKDQVTGEAFWTELTLADLPLFLAARSSIFITIIVCDAYLTARIFSWFYTPLTFRDLWPMRGYTMMYTILHPAVGQGWWYAFLVRRTGAPVRTVVGLMLLTFFVFLYFSSGVLLYLVYSVYDGVVELERSYRLFLYGLTVVTVFAAFYGTTFWVFKWKWGFLERFRSREIFTMLDQARLRHYLVIFAWRLPQLIVFTLSEYYCARAFNIDISFLEFITRFPIVLVHVILIPSVANVGPLTMGWLVAYSDFGSEEAIVVCTLLQIIVGHGFKVLIGLACLGPAGKDAATIRLHDDVGPHAGEEIPVTPGEP